MSDRMLVVLACAWILTPAGPASAQAAVTVAEDGGLARVEVQAIRLLASATLRAHGLAVSEQSDPEQLRPVDESTIRLLKGTGISRLFVLRIGGQLGRKIPLSMEEVDIDTLKPLCSATLVATGIEEAEKVVPRLAEAVLWRRPAEQTARLTTVTQREAEPNIKMPTENFWVVGASAYPGGFSLAWMREMQDLRLDVTLAGTGKFGDSGTGAGYFGIDVAWLPREQGISPYLGGGAGIVWVDNREGTGCRLEAGLELFRLHSVRVMAGADIIVPFYNAKTNNPIPGGAKTAYPGLQIRLAF